MARIGLFTWPGSGHVNPMAALGRRLSKMGHSVSFVSVLDMKDIIEAAGIRFVGYGFTDYPKGRIRELNERLSKLAGLQALRCIVDGEVKACSVQLDELPCIIQNENFDMLLVDATQPAPLTVAEHLGVPAVTIDLLPPIFDESSAPPFIFGWDYERTLFAHCRNYIGNRVFFSVWSKFMRVVNERRREWSLPAHRNINDIFSQWLRITQMPAILDFPRRRLPSNFVYAGPFIDGEGRQHVPFPWERLDGRKLIYASLGTLQNGVVAIFQAIVDAVQDRPDLQLVLSIGKGTSMEELEELPRGSIVVENAPQLELIERASLVITHAGQNTALEALQAGKPMVAIPIASDQPGVAARLKRLGVAVVVPVKDVNALRLRAAIDRVLKVERFSLAAKACRVHLSELRGLDIAASRIDAAVRDRTMRRRQESALAEMGPEVFVSPLR